MAHTNAAVLMDANQIFKMRAEEKGSARFPRLNARISREAKNAAAAMAESERNITFTMTQFVSF
jgi:hypothetical protein